MSKEKNKRNGESRVTGVSRKVYRVLVFSFLTGLAPGIAEQRVFSQSTYGENKLVEQYSPNGRKYTITSTPANGTGSALSGRDGVSLKSTDAAIDPSYQQPPICMNCGIVDFTDGMIPGDATAIISGGIISGVIASEIFRREAHRYYPPGAAMSMDKYPSIRHFNSGPANHIINFTSGIPVDETTRAIIQQPVAPYHFSGDWESSIDSELKLDSHAR